MGLQARLLDEDPLLLAQSYRLRYQVYCVERRFLSADDYPDQLEFDAFDRDSVHVGAVDRHGALVATARLVKPNRDGLPLFRYCTLFPYEHALDDVGNTVVEVSRVSISRAHLRHRENPPWSALAASDVGARVSAPAMGERRRHSAEPFLTLLKAAYCGARRVGATHVIGATDAALHRRLVRFGFPYRVAGPTVDYYGPVAPHLMDLDELDRVILGDQFPALDGFHVGLVPGASRRPDEHEGQIAWSRAESLRAL